MPPHEDEISEQTPLLGGPSVAAAKPAKPKWKVYAVLLGFLVILTTWVYNVRRHLPVPLSDPEARSNDDFPGIHCYNEYLSKFTEPHSANQRNNVVMNEWIASLVKGFQKDASANNVTMEAILRDPTTIISKRNKLSQDEYWYVESSNIMVRLHGRTGNTSEALLVNAHYDSVSTSHGVTDNGMGTAVAIELLRYFVRHPPEQTLIFLFNNFEEGGLIGADVFIQHPWFQTVKFFVNLEGTGAGGRPLLFRSNHLAATRQLARSKAKLLHGSPFGNGLLKSRTLRSDTDYTVFTAHGAHGFDIGFYEPRSHYHTQRDDLAHTTRSSLQYMGQMALAAVRCVDASESLTEDGDDDEFIYYDILGRFMVVYSFTTAQVVNVIALVLVPVVVMVVGRIHSNGVSREERKRRFVQKARYYALGLSMCIITAASMAGVAALVCLLLLTVNPLMTYGGIYLAALCIFLGGLFGLLLCQWMLEKIPVVAKLVPGKPKQSFDFYLSGLTMLWWVLVVAAAHLTSHHVTGSYYGVYFLGSTALSWAVYYCIPEEHEWRYPVTMVVQTLVPTILMAELCFLTMDALRHTTADGTPERAVYLFMTVPILLITLQLLPWIQLAGNKKKPTLIADLALAVVLVICLAASPYNSSWSPNRVLFNQEYYTTDSLATVSVVTTVGLQSTLRQALSTREYDTLSCDPFNGQTKCVYETSLTPLYGRRPGEASVHIRESGCANGRCQLNLTTVARNSFICQLQFRLPVYNARAWINQHSVAPEGSLGALVATSPSLGKKIMWDIEYPDSEGSNQVMLNCLYDEWTNGEIPAFTTLRNNMPESSLLTMRGGVGLVKVHYDPWINLSS
ncbi:uncharacterized protein BYT42DRAFT_553259 [Radiomyces spectabilis]|uniref:uncharacterized protein n=1 Tax=Radiomyces spectabilis TaxID=64574 RepID=UPI00221F55EB|nr:uncharacterized protein BYT42DRAFT_553259 [Radiomyces spectabilis]KAI8394077.1 hypothetical protein BYT42DRAFT_553259 [Radiomyces spectabilis]